MNSGPDLEPAAAKAVRRAVVSLAPKRRSKCFSETSADETTVAPIVGLSRRPRMKRSAPMSMSWRGISEQECANSTRVSPEILSTFNRAIGALGQSTTEPPAHATA